MGRLLRRTIVLAANIPFAGATLVVLDNEVLGSPLLMDAAALPLFLMGVVVAWVATIVLLHGYMLGEHPPAG